MFFKKEMTVLDYDCDCRNQLKLSSAMGYMQQTSGEQLDVLGIPYEKLLEENMVFLLSKSCIKIHEMPIARQKIIVGTAAVTTRGARFVREFTIEDLSGRRLISCLTLWLLVDPSTRKILRPASFPYDIQFQESLVQTVIDDVPFPKLLDDGMRDCIEVPIRYSSIDCNNHVNNSVYADFVCDSLPLELLVEKGLDTLVVSFHNEARHGNVLSIGRTQISEHEFYVSGSKEDDTRCFEALAIFKETALNTRA